MFQSLKKISLLFVFFLMISALAGCEIIDQLSPDIRSLSIVPETLIEEAYLDDFDITTIQLRAVTQNWSTQYTEVRLSMLSGGDRDKLTREGTHRITINYRGQQVAFTVVLRQRSQL